MTWAVVAITRGGADVARRIHRSFEGSEMFLHRKWARDGEMCLDDDFRKSFKQVFHDHGLVICVMASGIAVRSVAPLLESKETDPGIVVVDEGAHFAISLVGGHIGRANKAACDVAAALGATPVVTTASDILGILSVDMLAEALDAHIKDLEAAKNVTAHAVNGGTVSFSTDIELEIDPPAPYKKGHKGKYGVIVSPFVKKGLEKCTSHLVPRRVVAGVGCRKGVGKERVLDALEKAFATADTDIKALSIICSAEAKAKERGIHDAARALGVPVKFVYNDRIAKVEDRLDTSPFVKRSIGIGAVCEPCAYLCAGGCGRFLLNKTAYDGVTISLFLEGLQ